MPFLAFVSVMNYEQVSFSQRIKILKNKKCQYITGLTAQLYY